MSHPTASSRFMDHQSIVSPFTIEVIFSRHIEPLLELMREPKRLVRNAPCSRCGAAPTVERSGKSSRVGAVEVQAGNPHASKHSSPVLWALLESEATSLKLSSRGACCGELTSPQGW